MKRYLTLALLTSILLTVAIFIYSQTAPAASGAVVGISHKGKNVLELLGRSDQNGPDVTHYGYITHIVGLPTASLFSDPSTRTEATARFTFFATTTLTARHLLSNIIVTAAPGTLTIYHNETPTGNFNDPGSFATGEPIATYSARYHDILNVQAPNMGIISAVADLIQLSVNSFRLDGVPYRLGRRNLRERLWATGQGTRTQDDPLQAFFLWGGNVIIVKKP
jgi:hypothetical protein